MFLTFFIDIKRLDTLVSEMYAKMSKKDSTVKRRSDKFASIKDHPNVIEVASKLSILIESVKCSICLEVMMSPARIKCGHTFCTLCIENAIQFNKAGEGTELRKLSGGSAKANCPLCKTSNINKRSITGDPVLEEKIKIIKELQDSIRNDAKELGFDLSSIKPTTLSRGKIEGRSGLTPSKKPTVANKEACAEKKRKKELFEVVSAAETKTPKTYGKKNENTRRKSNIARHFKKPVTSNIYDNIYDEFTDESSTQEQKYSKTPAKQYVKPNLIVSPSAELVSEICSNNESEKVAFKRGTKSLDYSNDSTLDKSGSSLTLRSISPSRDNAASTNKQCESPILDSHLKKNIGAPHQKVVDQCDVNAESSSSLALHTISPRPKRHRLITKQEEKEKQKDGTSDLQLTPSNSKEKDVLTNSSSSLSLHLNNTPLAMPREPIKICAEDTIVSNSVMTKQQPKRVDQSILSADSNSSLALHTISPCPKKLKLTLQSEEKENLKYGTCDMPFTSSTSKKKEILKNSNSSLSLHSKNSHLPMPKDSMTVCDENITEPEKNEVHLEASSSLSLHSVDHIISYKGDIVAQCEVEKQEKAKSYHNRIDDYQKNLPSKEKNLPSEVNLSSSKNKRKADVVSIVKLDKQNEVRRRPNRSIPFMIKGNHWRTSVFGSKNKTNVIFLKMGKIAPNEKIDFSITNSTMDAISLTIKGRKHFDRLEQDPDKSGIVLETETSTSTQNTQGNQITDNHQSLFDNEVEKPTVDDFDMNEEETTIMTKGKNYSKEQICGFSQQNDYKATEDIKRPSNGLSNENDVPMEELEEFVNMDDPFSIDESDDDLFEATPEATFRPLNTSTTKSNRKMLSQSPITILKWKDIIQRNREITLLENFEIALHGDFGDGVKSGEAYPSKAELWQLLTQCGATVYKSVNLFTFARGVTGLCIVNDSLVKDSGYKQGPTRVSNMFTRQDFIIYKGFFQDWHLCICIYQIIFRLTITTGFLLVQMWQ